MSYYNSYDSRGGDTSSRRDYGSSGGYSAYGGSSYGAGAGAGAGAGGSSGYGGSSYGNGVGGAGGASNGGYGGSSYGAGGGNSYGGSSDDFGSGLSNIDFTKTELVPFEKDFYIEHPDVSKRAMQEADAWRASKQIVIVGKDVPKPCMTFEEASMPEYILSEVLKQGFDKPTPIQSQGWPMALKGKNMVGIRYGRIAMIMHSIYSFGKLFLLTTSLFIHQSILSATGSGKTLAFLLPAMIHINAQVSIVKIILYCNFEFLNALDGMSISLRALETSIGALTQAA